MITNQMKFISVVDSVGDEQIVRLSQENPTILNMEGGRYLPHNWLFIGVKKGVGLFHANDPRTPPQ